jgi:hypothetical protein
MAGECEMSNTMIVVDTSYLLELFRVPTFSTERSIEIVTKKFLNAIKNKHRLFVPSPCLFELGNHIVDVIDVGIRRQLKQKFHDTVFQANQNTVPFVILHFQDHFNDICDCFVNTYQNDDIGIVDVCTVLEAQRLKKKNSGFGYKIHIWTKDKKLKAYEPDPETDPFLG